MHTHIFRMHIAKNYYNLQVHTFENICVLMNVVVHKIKIVYNLIVTKVAYLFEISVLFLHSNRMEF